MTTNYKITSRKLDASETVFLIQLSPFFYAFIVFPQFRKCDSKLSKMHISMHTLIYEINTPFLIKEVEETRFRVCLNSHQTAIMNKNKQPLLSLYV